ncbi:hypothetical protein EAE99_010939 [Botrytis elliptica]|nr:hypothetical protein EAE99_010939 [Botrytis elliptica]
MPMQFGSGVRPVAKQMQDKIDGLELKKGLSITFLEENSCNCYFPDRRMNYVVGIGEVAFQSVLKDVPSLGPCETFRIIAGILLHKGTELTDNTGRPRLSIFRLQTKSGRLGRVWKIL